jgi:hypothetical protein
MRLRQIALALILFGFSHEAIAAKLTLFRWNPGYRAESEPVISREINEQELKDIRAGKLPKESGIFRGCYLTHVDFQSSRSLASKDDHPKSEIRKICTLGNR